MYEAIPDFGGYVVKADSEGQPGPFAYRRSHADGANMLASVLEPYGGTVHWRAFVYDHRQDWRDRTTDRARAAYDHFTPLDGELAANAVLQVKHGPLDFQVREPVSSLIGAMPRIRLAVEMRAAQEYTGQQRHVCRLGSMWSEVLRFRPGRPGPGRVAGAGRAGGGVPCRRRPVLDRARIASVTSSRLGIVSAVEVPGSSGLSVLHRAVPVSRSNARRRPDGW